MVKVKFFLLLIFGSALLQSQSLLDAYRQFIPQAYLDSSEIVSIITSNLQAAAETDPELIYDFLQSFDTVSQAFDTERFRDYLIKFSQKRKDRSDWALSELKKLERNEQDQNLHRISASFYHHLVLKDLSETSSREIRSAADPNKRDYFVYQYYSGDSTLRFDPAVDYSGKRNQFEYTFVDSFRNFCEEFTTDPDTTKCGRMVKKISDNWFMFDRTAKNDPAPFSPSDLVSLYLRQKYSFEEERSQFGVGAVYLRTSLFSIDLILSGNPFGTVQTNYPFVADQTGITLFYRYRIQPYKTILSYVKCDLTYLFTVQPHNGSVELVMEKPHEQKIIDPDYIDRFYPLAPVSITSISSAMFNIMTPLLYMNEDILIELSTGISLNKLSYRYHYDYAIREYIARGDVLWRTFHGSAGDPNETKTIRKTRILMSLNLLWNVYGGLNLQYSIGPRQATVSVQQYF